MGADVPQATYCMMASMTAMTRHPTPRARRHGAVLQPAPRRALERAGWRTTLEFRENHVRSLDGRLLRVEPVWVAEAERYAGEIVVASSEGATADEAWEWLHADIAAARVTVLRGVSVTGQAS